MDKSQVMHFLEKYEKELRKLSRWKHDFLTGGIISDMLSARDSLQEGLDEDSPNNSASERCLEKISPEFLLNRLNKADALLKSYAPRFRASRDVLASIREQTAKLPDIVPRYCQKPSVGWWWYLDEETNQNDCDHSLL
jgi:hypothetical protein